MRVVFGLARRNRLASCAVCRAPVGFQLDDHARLATLLDLGQIPLRSEDRHDSDPIVLAGGPVATQPEPMAPFIDAFLIGEHFMRAPAIPAAVRAIKEALR